MTISREMQRHDRKASPRARGFPRGKAASRRLAFLLFQVGLSAAAAAASGTGPICSWNAAQPCPQARGESPSAVIGGRLYVFGGFQDASLQASQRVDVYDPASDAWSSASDVPVKLTHAGVAVDGSLVWFAGGFQGDHPGFAVADVRTYDAATDQWIGGPPLPAPRAGGALVRIDRELHYFGGVLADRNTDSGDHWRLDLDQPGLGWSARAPLPNPRNHLSGAAVAGKIYAIGGQHNHDQNPLDTAWVHAYDPATDAWTAVASLPFARSHAEPGTSVHEGKILVAGGRGPTPGALSIAEVVEYDPAADVWSTRFSLPMALFAPVAQPIGDLYVVSCGGPSVFQPQVWTWRRSLAEVAPSARKVDAGASAPAAGWCGDEGFLGGQAFTNSAVGDVANTSEDALYRSERSGSDLEPASFAYSFAAAPGYWRLRVHFAEIYWGAPAGGPGGVGRRVFDVRLEGGTVLDQYDITASAGGAVTAVVESFELAVTDGAVDLEFEASVDRPSVAAIELLDLSADSVASYCTTSPNSVGPGAVIGWQGSTSLSAQTLVLTVDGGPADKAGLFFFGSQQDQTPFGDGVRCVAGTVFRLVTVMLDANGSAVSAVDFGSSPGSVIAPGSTWNFQMRYRDPFGPLGSGFNYTDGLTAVFWP